VRTVSGRSALTVPSLSLALTILFTLALSAPQAHAQSTGPVTQWETVIEYQTTSPYTPENVNVTWTNTDGDCLLQRYDPRKLHRYKRGRDLRLHHRGHQPT
jgi:hypothetical protein